MEARLPLLDGSPMFGEHAVDELSGGGAPQFTHFAGKVLRLVGEQSVGLTLSHKKISFHSLPCVFGSVGPFVEESFA